jgi:transposase
VLRIHHRSVVPYSIIARILGLSKATVKTHFMRYELHISEPGTRGRPSIVSNELRTELIHNIEIAYTNARP